MRIPVIARTAYSLRRRGSNRVRPIETASNAMIAIRKRIATNEIGGKSCKPILIASQVELQTAQSVNQANGTPHPTRGRQLRFAHPLLVFISAKQSRRTVATLATVVGENKDRQSLVRRLQKKRGSEVAPA